MRALARTLPGASARALVALLLCGVVAAQNVDLQRIGPRGAQRGTTVALELRGRALAGAEALVFDRTGITATDVESDRSDRVRAQLTIAADAPLGPHAVRVRTTRGLSDPLVFHVGALPVVDEVEPNADVDAAQDLSLGVTVHGTVSGEDVDVFRFEAPAGSRVRAVAEVMRLGVTGFDPLVELLDASGEVLVRGDDAVLVRRDAIAEAVVPAGGVCFVRIRDAAHRANGGSPYRLHVDAGAQPLVATVLSVPPHVEGAAAPRMLLGADGPIGSSTPWARDLERDSGAAPDGATTWWPDVSLAPLVLRVSSLPTVREVEPNDRLDATTALPELGPDGVAAEGALSEPGDMDRFALELAKGQTVQVSVWARRLRSPLDAALSIRGEGVRTQYADDDAGLDPVERFTAKEAGTYTFTVYEHLDRGGPDHVYRMEITPVAPDVTAVLPGDAKQFSVPRGRRAYVPVGIERDGLRGPLAVELSGLPAGVTARVPGGATRTGRAVALIEASEDAPLGASGAGVSVLRPGADGDAAVAGAMREELMLVRGNNNAVLQGHLQTRLPVAVTEAVPFDVAAAPVPAPLVRRGKQSLSVLVLRDDGYDAPITVGLMGLPPGVRAQSSLRVEGDTVESIFTLEAAGDAALGEAHVIAWAQAQVDGVGVRIASDAVTLEVVEPVLALEAKRALVEREGEATLAVELKRAEGAPEGDFEVTLVGLPHDIASEPLTLGAEETALTFPLRAGPKAPTGLHRGLTLEARIAAADGAIRQTLTGIELRVQQPAKPPEAVAVEASASRLEKLRAEHAARVEGERAEAEVAEAPEAMPAEMAADATPDGAEGAAEAKPDAKPEAAESEAPDGAAPSAEAKPEPSAPPPAEETEEAGEQPPQTEPAKDPEPGTGAGGELVFATFAPRRRVARARLAAGRVDGDGADAAPPSFLNDVVPVLTASGCNAGACHGASRGQDGFHLSLFGYDAAGDHARLLEERYGRRVDLAFPEESLLLTKATGAVPHTGGKLLEPGGEDYETLADWIRAGAPSDVDTAPRVVGLTLEPDALVLAPGEAAELRAIARYSDGTERDVTRLALVRTNDASVATLDRDGTVSTGGAGEAFLTAAFATETVGTPVIVRSTPADAPWSDPADGLTPATWIDELVAEKLRAVGAEPAPLCTDEEFLRRVSLALVGLPPSPEERAAFLADERPMPEKRAALVHALVQRPEFADQWVMRFAELLRIRSGREVSPKAAQAWFEWLQSELRAGVGIDDLVKEQLTASGDNFDVPQASYFLAERDPKVLAENAAQSLLGVRISCAQCHNHPFDRWTQDDYAGFVAFFSEVRSKRAEDPDERTVSDRRGAGFRHPTTKQVVEPRFLGGEAPDLGRRLRRDVLAEWLTAPENPWFARNVANRVWAAYMGRGVVEPVDDVRVTNPPSSAALLDALGARLVESDFDLADLATEIVLSRAYQRTSAAPGGDSLPWDRENFAAFGVRRLRAETLSDSLAAVTGVDEDLPRLAPGVRATQLADGADASYFLRAFGRAPRETVCACEVSDAPSLSQALHLVNGRTVHEKVVRGSVVQDLIDAGADDVAAVTELYERALCRAPLPPERDAVLEVLAGAGEDRKAALEDVFWALLTSNEFLFQR